MENIYKMSNFDFPSRTRGEDLNSLELLQNVLLFGSSRRSKAGIYLTVDSTNRGLRLLVK